MPDKDLATMVKSLIEQNKAVMEMIKFQYDINETSGPSMKRLEFPNNIQQYIPTCSASLHWLRSFHHRFLSIARSPFSRASRMAMLRRSLKQDKKQTR